MTDEILWNPGVDINEYPFDLGANLNPLIFAGLVTLTTKLNGWASYDPAYPDSVWDEDATSGDLKALRAREGMERFYITDINNPAGSARAQSTIYLMYDEAVVNAPQNMNHVPGGGNVLYMDGHVEFLRYPSETPMSVGFATVLTAI